MPSECDHRKSDGDPHPLCEPCLEKYNLPLCTKHEPCDLCRNQDAHYWKRKAGARKKRAWMRRQSGSTKETAAANSIQDDEIDLEYPGSDVDDTNADDGFMDVEIEPETKKGIVTFDDAIKQLETANCGDEVFISFYIGAVIR